MARKDLKSALGASVKAEDKAVRDRFAKAEALLGDRDAGDSPTPKSARQEQLERVTRDSFTMPAHDYDRIGALRERCLKNSVSITKSELLRAGLIALQEMDDARLRETVGKLVKVKTGRPTDQ